MGPEDMELFLRTHVRGLMLDVQEWLEGRLVELRVGTPYADFTAQEVRVFALLHGRQRVLSDLAIAMPTSRRSMEAIVKAMVGRGILELAVIPGEPGEKLVTVSDAGERLRKLSVGQIWTVEREMANVIGRDGLEALRLNLAKLVAAGHGPQKGRARGRRKKDH